jgi:hypothetical protein
MACFRNSPCFGQRRLFLLAGLLVLTLAVLSPAANATVAGTTYIAPGTQQFLFGISAPAGEVLVAHQTVPFTYSTSAGTNSGMVVEAVYSEGVGGTLDFFYQVFNSANSSTSLERSTVVSFSQATCGGLTGVCAEYLNGGTEGTLSGGGFHVNAAGNPVHPDTADLDMTGKTVGFSFYPPFNTNDVAPGTWSDVFVVSTDQKFYTPGNVNIIDGGTVTIAGYQPVTVPEPASFALFGLGLLAVAGIRKHAKNQ